MKIRDILNLLDARVLCGEELLDGEVNSAFGCDMMSDVLAFVKEQAVLITGLCNPQVVRTAEMMDMRCIVFVRGKNPPEEVVSLAKESGIVTGFAFFGGTLCGVVASNNACDAGKIGFLGAKKAADLISFCDRFGISVLTLVDSEGLCKCACAKCTARLATAYANATCAKVTAVVGKAYGAGFTLLGSKAIGADLEIALEGAVISVMSPESAVAFLMNDQITQDKSRADVEKEWCEKYASATLAAEKGDIDDIVEEATLRARICSALYMLSAKADGCPDRKYFRTPL